MKKKALHRVFAAIFLIHLLLAVTVAASPTTSTGLFRDGNNNAVAAAARSSRRLLLQQQQPRAAAAPAAMSTNTFRVNGLHQANGKPKVEFDASMKHNPGTNFNPRHN
uniref:Uncharacterized protein n=1 Tax=Oryza meridionalis TaxID=40149 RepID=A0A0E0F249_9ORYZ